MRSKSLPLTPSILTTLISSCDLACDGTNALKLLREYQSSLSQSSLSPGDPREGRRVNLYRSKNKNALPYNFAISALGKESPPSRSTAVLVSTVLSLLHEMESSEDPTVPMPDKYTYGRIAMILASLGMPEKSLLILRKTEQLNIVDEHQVNNFIRSCLTEGSGKYRKWGLETLRRLGEGGFDAHGVVGDVPSSSKDSKPLRPSIDSFRILLSCLSMYGPGGLEVAGICRSVLEDMENGEEWCAGVRPDAFCYVSVIAGCHPGEYVHPEKVDEGVENNRDQEKIERNFRDWTTENRRLSHMAREVLAEIEGNPDVETPYKAFDLAMMSCVWSQDVDGALEIFRGMEGKGWRLERRTLLNICNVLMEHKRFEEADGILEKYRVL